MIEHQSARSGIPDHVGDVLAALYYYCVEICNRLLVGGPSYSISYVLPYLLSTALYQTSRVSPRHRRALCVIFLASASILKH